MTRAESLAAVDFGSLTQQEGFHRWREENEMSDYTKALLDLTRRASAPIAEETEALWEQECAPPIDRSRLPLADEAEMIDMKWDEPVRAAERGSAERELREGDEMTRVQLRLNLRTLSAQDFVSMLATGDEVWLDCVEDADIASLKARHPGETYREVEFEALPDDGIADYAAREGRC